MGHLEKNVYFQHLLLWCIYSAPTLLPPWAVLEKKCMPDFIFSQQYLLLHLPINADGYQVENGRGTADDVK